MKVGGFWKAPPKKDMLVLRENLKRALDLAEAFVDFTASLPFPDKERDYTMVCIEEPNGLYPMYEGTRLISNRGLDIPAPEYNDVFKEVHVDHSNALQGWTKKDEAYLIGPLPRYNLAYDKLSERAKAAAKRAGLGQHLPQPLPLDRGARGREPLRGRGGDPPDRRLRGVRPGACGDHHRGPAPAWAPRRRRAGCCSTGIR